MPASKRSRNSGARVSTKRGKTSKANSSNAVKSGKHSASDDENVEQEVRAAKRTKTEQTSASPERWTPYFKSKKLYAVEDGEAMQLAAAGDEQAGEFETLETTAMQVILTALERTPYVLEESSAERNLLDCDLTNIP